jgi:hypothetical protein
MSQSLGFYIDYDAPHSEENVRLVLAILREAVEQNWRSYSDGFSDESPEFPVNVDLWLSEIMCPRPQKAEGKKRELYQHVSATGIFFFDFSPVSSRTADLFVSCGEKTNELQVHVSFPERMLREVAGAREIWRMEREWEQFRKARGETGDVFGPAESDLEYWPWHERLVELQDNSPLVWPQNKACLLHIFEKLCSVLPVKQSDLDDPLGGENS